MCFSATASFAAAALVTAAGVYATSRVGNPREWPLAAMPLFFGVQQTIEGGLWLTLPTSPQGAASWLSHAFLVFALIVWPVLPPMAALVVESDALRRRMIGACALVGGGVSAYFAWMLLTQPHHALIAAGHIQYDIGATPVSVGGAYIVATTLGLLISSRRAVALLGLIVLAGSIVSYVAYIDTFISVWCFFAAAASVVIASHFSLAAAERNLR